MNTHSRSGLVWAPLNNNVKVRTAEPPTIDPPRTGGGQYWKYLHEVRCPCSHCPEKVVLGDLSNHVGFAPHWLPTHSYLGIPLTFKRTLSTSTKTPELMTCDPIRFTFSKEIFYLQTIACPDRRLLYHFVQVEGGEEDSRRFWAKISVASVDRLIKKGHATMTMRPTILDHHCRSNLLDIGNALVMTER